MDKETTTSVTIDEKRLPGLTGWQSPIMYQRKTFLSCALEYFEKYGINPVEHESPAKEMRNLSNAVIR